MFLLIEQGSLNQRGHSLKDLAAVAASLSWLRSVGLPPARMATGLAFVCQPQTK